MHREADPSLTPATDPIRLALLLDLAPRKLGSFEDLVVAIGAEARRRGHDVHVYCRAPVHAAFGAALDGLGVALGTTEALEAEPRRAVAELRGFDVLQLHHFGARAKVALLAMAAWPARVLYVDRGSGQPGDDLRPPLRRAAGRMLDRACALRFSGVRGVSNFVQARDGARFGDALCGTLYNGVDLSRFRPQDRGQRGRFRVLCVAHLIPQKGVDVLLEAVARMEHRDVHVTVVGDGPENERLRAQAMALGLRERVEFTGLRSDVPGLLPDADVFVHPAVWGEAFGYTIAEAMACGVPVVASAVGGIPEVVASGETGFLFPPRDVGQLAASLDMLARSPELRVEMGRAGRRRAEALFDLRACAARYVDWAESSTRS